MLSPLMDQFLFGRPLGYRSPAERSFERSFAEAGPRTVVRDTVEGFVFAIELPGFAPEEVKVDVTRDQLTVSGERKPSTPEGHQARRRERLSFTFNRTYSLPAPVEASAATAVVKNGVLTVTLPKVAEVRPRSIPVSVAH